MPGELAGECDDAIGERGDARQRVQRNARTSERTVNLWLLVAHDGPGGGVSRRCHVAYRVSAPGEIFRKDTAHVVVVEIIDDNGTSERRAGGDIVRREHTGAVELAHRD